MSGFIQNSYSFYASPVLLVGKKDVSLILCVDYSLVEDLMNELKGSVIFSKIDLRVGYHQVRMDHPDIHKTAFKIHSGHYEYLILLFGFTNAPSAPATFQSFMNIVFSKFIRIFF